jgi:tetratricopeptide (TPR) repeat protein
MTVTGSRMLIPAVLCTLALSFATPPQLCAVSPPEQEYWQLLSSRYQASSENYAEPLLEELAVFNSLYPRTAHGDSVAWMSGVMQEHQKKQELALASYLKLLYVYPQSPLVAPARGRLEALAGNRRRGITALFADNELEVLQDHVQRMLGQEIETQGGERGYFDFLLLLADAKVKDLAGYTVAQARHYLYRADYSWRADRVCVIIGDMQRVLRKWRSALLAYRTASFAAPMGESVSMALLNAGTVYLRPLKNYEMSRRTFKEVIEQFPASMDAAHASLMIAEVDLDQEKPEQALIRLEDTATRFPFPEIRIEAWEKAAWVYEHRLDDPAQGAVYLEKIVEEFPAQVKTAEVLIKLGKLREDKLRDPAGAVKAYVLLADLFSGNPLATRYLFRAAELTEGKLKDKEQAAAIYKRLADNYPETKEGKEASKKINDN